MEQISQTENLDSSLILVQHKLELMARFMEIKSINPKLKQSGIPKEIRCSTSTLQRYRHDIKMQSHYKSTDPTRTQKTSNDLKRILSKH